jgi:hypothetical protein
LFSIHLCDYTTVCRLFSNNISHTVLSSEVVHSTSQVKTLLSAHLWVLEGVQELESTGVARLVRDEDVVHLSEQVSVLGSLVLHIIVFELLEYFAARQFGFTELTAVEAFDSVVWIVLE